MINLNKNNLWIALILSLLIVAPFYWFLPNTSLFLVIIDTLIKFSLYFLGIFLTLNLITYLKNQTNHQKQVIKLLNEIKNTINHKEK
ncbi:hypothetical protein COI74_17510 [Bacillus wiedmannii]|uniref:Uncharacterized protein n=1 Tax=Bacillus wiedmannii TaxID=1890302 RepID=A0ABD6TLD5_9BACI|nr:hypothetical protein CN447_11600 [Bacillus thuringiensis]PFV43110.1 hypothetical protein COL14_28805 [Bacillus thuringiensis]PHG19384.1 hypothetical protein COI74_17510 [Bacillus wiedmannii]